MIPSVFVSSTVLDLAHLRSVVRDTLEELGLAPVMSEYGGVGYLPDQTAESSCYTTLAQCQLAVLVIGRRYGSTSKDGLSVTHKEYRAARERGIPTYCLVDSEILTLRSVFTANAEIPAVVYPTLDNPEKLFEFVAEISGDERSNAILGYGSARDVRSHLRTQLGHLFGELLSRHADPLQSEIRDVLAEVRTIRHSLIKEPQKDTKRLLFGLRLLLDDEFKAYRELLEQTPAGLESSLEAVLSAPNFATAIEGATGKKGKLVAVPQGASGHQDFIEKYPGGIAHMTTRHGPLIDGADSYVNYGVDQTGAVFFDEEAQKFLDAQHQLLLLELSDSGSPRRVVKGRKGSRGPA